MFITDDAFWTGLPTAAIVCMETTKGETFMNFIAKSLEYSPITEIITTFVERRTQNRYINIPHINIINYVVRSGAYSLNLYRGRKCVSQRIQICTTSFPFEQGSKMPLISGIL